ncbi:hypothetical protein L9F63_005491, partial [Diploptera punctata]
LGFEIGVIRRRDMRFRGSILFHFTPLLFSYFIQDFQNLNTILKNIDVIKYENSHIRRNPLCIVYGNNRALWLKPVQFFHLSYLSALTSSSHPGTSINTSFQDSLLPINSRAFDQGTLPRTLNVTKFTSTLNLNLVIVESIILFSLSPLSILNLFLNISDLEFFGRLLSNKIREASRKQICILCIIHVQNSNGRYINETMVLNVLGLAMILQLETWNKAVTFIQYITLISLIISQLSLLLFLFVLLMVGFEYAIY